MSDIRHPGPEWKWALPAGRILTLVLLAAVTVAVAAPAHRLAVGVGLAVSVAGSAYGLRFGPEQWPQRLIGLSFFAAGGVALLAIDNRAPGWLACGVAIMAGLVRLPQRAGLILAGSVTLAACLAPLWRGDHEAIPLMAAICGAGVVLGLVLGGVRNRAATAERLLEAEQLTRETAADRDRLAERQRLAREIHDILAHTLSAQSVQLEGARLLLERGDTGGAVLSRIQSAQRLARDGLEETRRAVQSLRGDARPLTDIVRTLADTAGARYEEHGEPWPLGPQGALTVERTVQEGLTNARKHAPGASVTVSLTYRKVDLQVEVCDTGSSSSSEPGDSTGGYGLAGMRERAELIGAHLDAGPHGKGYRICLTMPRGDRSAL